MPPQKKKGSSSSSEYGPYFHQIYHDRWVPLMESMASPTQHVALWNTFLGQAPELGPLEGSTSFMERGALTAFRYDTSASNGSYPQPPQTQGLNHYYWLDPGSLYPPLLLNPKEGENVLDLCAAPGGKSFVLSLLMWGSKYRALHQGGHHQQQPERTDIPEELREVWAHTGRGKMFALEKMCWKRSIRLCMYET